MATLVFLGRLADVAGTPEREVAAGPLAEVLADLPASLAIALLDERVRVALNGELVRAVETIVLEQGDELAFLPPVSGG
ncbi:MAG: MoaD/ThiS family protein [Sphingomonadales bacterium]|nr:MoaD/ThiS family protein [Sphingomonadales bacterium]